MMFDSGKYEGSDFCEFLAIVGLNHGDEAVTKRFKEIAGVLLCLYVCECACVCVCVR